MDVAFNPSVDVVRLRTDEEGTKYNESTWENFYNYFNVRGKCPMKQLHTQSIIVSHLV